MSVSGELAAEVRSRAQGRCQYCRMHQALQGATFHLEHIIPKSAGGSSDLANLALACPSCNLQKADRSEAIDPETQRMARLFHPVRHIWSENFRFKDYQIEGLTPVGRATVTALNLNHPRRLRIRAAEERFGLFPP